MKTKSSKNKRHIGILVQRGFAIHQQLSLLNEEFKSIKDALKAEAPNFAHEHLPLLEKDSEGKQWVLRAKACECRIVFPGPKITAEFDPSESNFLTIRSLAGERFKSLFRKVTVYRPTDKKTFRNQVISLLDPKTAVPLLELCSTPSEPKAVWKAMAADKKRKEAAR
jgi:hypothetical protein